MTKRYGFESMPSEQQEDEEFGRFLDSLMNSIDRGRRSAPESTESVEKGDYYFFRDKGERDELAHYCEAVTDHLHDAGIPNLVVMDRSSRPLYLGVMEYWRYKYPDEKMPGIYFMNPKGFKSREAWTEEDLKDFAMECFMKDDLLEDHKDVPTEAEIIEEVTTTYKRLYEDREKPLLVFDSCIHSGDTLTPVKDILKKAGFAQIEIGSVTPAGMNSAVKADFYITRNRPEKGCYPFDKDRMIEKTFDHVYSTPSESDSKRKISRELREEVTKIIREKIAEKSL